MSKELVISANRHETKVAILEDDQLVEVYFQRANEYSLAGSIHKGKVTRVLPGMQSAFVDLGLERDTFLYVSDFFEENEDFDRIMPAGAEARKEDRPPRQERERSERPPAAIPTAIEPRPEPRNEPRNEPRPEPRNETRLELRNEPRVEPLVERIVERAQVQAPILEEEEGPEEGESGAAAPAGAPGREDAEERERRGRRSRRRRNRGRGFPESKYASDANEPSKSEGVPAPVPVSLASAAVESTPHTIGAPIEDDFEFPVLPGESLAKYRHPQPQQSERKPVAEAVSEPKPVPVEDQPGEVHPAAAAPAVEETPAGDHGEALPMEVAPEPVVEAAPHVVAVDEPGDAGELLYASNGAAVAREPEPESPAPPAPEIAPEAEAIADIIAMERESSAFSAEELAESPIPAFEMLEIEHSLAEEEVEEDAEEGESPEEPGAEPKPQQAQVREPGGRYQQRGPRRMRRRQRGGGGPGAAPPAAPVPALAPENGGPAPAVRPAPRPERSSGMPSITELLKEGQEILVQIAKEPLGQKGARITSHIALPGRYVVFMPTLEHMGVSRKIASDEERLRLKKILQAHRSTVAGGFIVRTAGEGRSEEEILADMNFLSNLWIDIRHKSEKKPAPLLLHHDLDIVQRILRDQVTDQFKSIWVDHEEAYESILRFVQRFQPAMVGRVKLYTRSAPIFDAFNITPELEKALRPKVWLKSGGYIVINQTEALVAIDVNTGKYVGKSNRLEDTIVKTNTEAVKEIVRQIRLRDLGGIIVVDFIDMDERKNRQKVMQVLEEAMRADKAPNKILQFNDFGLVAITRKRVKQSLERALCSPCPYCEGAGYVKSVQTTVADILVEAHKMAKAVEGANVMLRVHPEVAKYLKSNQNKYLEEIEEVLRKPVLVKGDPALHQDKFDLA